jgi:hypothetical protein
MAEVSAEASAEVSGKAKRAGGRWRMAERGRLAEVIKFTAIVLDLGKTRYEPAQWPVRGNLLIIGYLFIKAIFYAQVNINFKYFSR